MTENDEVDIGTRLKNEREKLGFTLQNVALKTCIRQTYLESIENNQFSDLPGRAYVTGFVKAYARHLGVDSAPLLTQLNNNHFGSDLPPLLKPLSPVMRHPGFCGKSSPRPGWKVLFILSLFALVLGTSIYFLIFIPGQYPAKVTSNTILPVDGTSPGPVVAAPVADTSTVSTAQDVVTPSVNEGQSAAVAEKTAENNSFPYIPAGGATVRMLALSESSLIIDVDGRKPRQYKLYDGLDLVWDVKETVRIELSEPGIARFWLGDQALNVDEMKSLQLQTAPGD